MPSAEYLSGDEDVCRGRTGRPAAGLTPDADRTASVRWGRHSPPLPSPAAHAGSCTRRYREVAPLPVRAAEGMVL
ncbi:hypothetical protein SCWH03_39290 [Streptomyces pacificus]|uniref:Uncharacterized protein n=1 Tax=Streptomyces pacificus TaxID=2705029 RepID=A0A6A0AXM2_9ACTN|nr:hypothetical protein SCWH03_39290 [Streptomyces pacificus]